MSIPIIRRALFGAVVPLGLAASSVLGPASAGSLNVIASFTAKTSRLDVATFADPNQKPSTVGLLSISQTNAVALRRRQLEIPGRPGAQGGSSSSDRDRIGSLDGGRIDKGRVEGRGHAHRQQRARPALRHLLGQGRKRHPYPAQVGHRALGKGAGAGERRSVEVGALPAPTPEIWGRGRSKSEEGDCQSRFLRALCAITPRRTSSSMPTGCSVWAGPSFLALGHRRCHVPPERRDITRPQLQRCVSAPVLNAKAPCTIGVIHDHHHHPRIRRQTSHVGKLIHLARMNPHRPRPDEPRRVRHQVISGISLDRGADGKAARRRRGGA